MAIDNTSCINAVNTIKNYVTACFAKCTEKGSTFSGTQKLANLETAIDLIPQSSSGGGGDSPVISENINGEAFDLFTVTKPDEITPNTFTIDFGSVGVTWQSITLNRMFQRVSQSAPPKVLLLTVNKNLLTLKLLLT